MIIAQSLSISAEHIAPLMETYRQNGYDVKNILWVDDGLAFDVTSADDLVFVRFLRDPQSGNLRGVQMVDADHTGLAQVLNLLRPFLAEGQEGYVLTTTGHQEELEGFYVRRDGVYVAKNIRVTAECSTEVLTFE